MTVILAETCAEIIEEPDPETWVIRDGNLGTGKLTADAPGVMSGDADFIARGRMSVRVARNGTGAELLVGWAIGRLEKQDEQWCGAIDIEGYPMRVEFDSKSGAIRFLDTK